MGKVGKKMKSAWKTNMDLRMALLRNLSIFLCLVLFLSGCSRGDLIGPQLVSQDEAIRLVKEKVGLVQINHFLMCTTGPVCYLIIGTDDKFKEKAAWVDTEVRYVVNLEDGIPFLEAVEIAFKHGFSYDAHIQLVYNPQFQGDHYPKLKESESKVFWLIRDKPGGDVHHELWLDFRDGKVIYDRYF